MIERRPVTPAPTLASGVVLAGRFEILEPLGRGGMGVVYRAFDRQLDAHVAVKTLRQMDAASLRRLKREFRALQGVRHPNLVALGELLEEQGRWFFSMEHVRGTHFLAYCEHPVIDLVTALDDDRTHTTESVPRGAVGSRPVRSGFDEERLRACLLQLAGALDALHRAGKVHRDIKSSNVLVTERGRLVIVDFGLVGEVLGTDGGRGGTLAYVAPEQALGGRVTPAVDWYAVGVLLYRALTGVYPHVGDAAQVVAAKRAGDVIRPALVGAQVPDDLDELCMALLAPAPEDRPGAEEVLRRLGGAAREARVDIDPRRTFVGRKRERTLLHAALARARAGEASVVLIEGESGVGKTALVEQFVREIGGEDEPPQVFSGRCYQHESVPFKAIDELIDGIAEHLARLPERQSHRLLPRDIALVATSFPVLRRIPRVERAVRTHVYILDARQRRARSFGAARELFARLATRPLVLVLEDLQWADDDSLALLAEVLRAPAPPLVVIGTVRTQTDASMLIDARSLEQRLGTEVERITLDVLDTGEAARLALKLARSAGAGAIDSQAIVREGIGHPLFIDALVRHRMGEGDGQGPRLADALWALVTDLPAAQRRLIECLAIAGRPLSHDMAAAAIASSPAEVASAAADLAAARMVRTTGAGRGHLIESFHDRLSAAVASALSDEARRHWHARLALAFEELAPDQREALAEHWRRAGRRSRAAEHALVAAREADRALAFDHATRLYRAALADLPPDAPVRGEALCAMATAYANAGRGVEAGQAFLAAIEHVPPEQHVDLRRRAAESLLMSGSLGRGMAALREALDAVGLSYPRTPRRAALGFALGRARLALSRVGPRRSLRPHEVARLDVSHSAALALAMIDTIRGAYFQTQHLLLSLRSGSAERASVALSMEACFQATGGPSASDRVERTLARARGLAAESGTAMARGWTEAGTGVAALLTERWAPALGHLGRAEAIFRDECAGMEWELATIGLVSLGAQTYLGDMSGVRARHDLLRQSALERGDAYMLAHLEAGYLPINAWLVRGELDAARAMIAHALDAWPTGVFHQPHLYRMLGRAQVLIASGDGDGALAWLRGQWRACERALYLRIRATRIILLEARARAALLAATGGEAHRATHLASAAADAHALHAMDTSFARALAAQLQAGVSALRGDLGDAVQAQRRAREGFEGLGADLHAAVAGRRLGELLGGDEGAAERARAADTLARLGASDLATTLMLYAPR